MSILALDPARVELAGLQAIEASAGTGKTWSIAALYLRLVLEAALPVERILVVTYTTAATAELKGRIRARLIEAREAFRTMDDGERRAPSLDGPVLSFVEGGRDGEGLRRFSSEDETQLPRPPLSGGSGVQTFSTKEDSADPVLARLLASIAPQRAETLLTLAIESFDLAAIHTIHGFCQRALAERAFESGQAFEAELMTDQTPLLRQTVQDIWRREMAAVDHDAEWIGWLLSRLPGPEALLTALQSHLGKPYLRRLPPPAEDDAAQAVFDEAFAAARQHWAVAGAEVIVLLSQWTGLSKTSYKPEQIARHGAALAAWLEGRGDYAEPSLTLFTPAKLQAGTTKSATTPEHPLFATLDTLLVATQAVEAARERRYGHLLLRALDACEGQLAQRKAQLNRLSFDDLLLQLHQALQGEGGAVLAEALGQRYGAALIDEFQDTDPIQYRIFHRLFGDGHPLFFVGDPKQAIYSFRGADLQAYLNARAQAGRSWLLDTNRRSVAPLVAAVNGIFSRQPQSFLDERLPFLPVAASPTPIEPLQEGDISAAPLSFWFLAREETDSKGKPKALNKGDANARIAAAVAADIARRLRLADAGSLRIGERPLVGGDIAVLVKSHYQGRLLREALAALNIASVRYGQESVFDSREAMEVERLLLAVAEPGREGLLRAALTTDLFGCRGDDIAALEQDGALRDTWLQRFQHWHQLARERGFIVMWSTLLAEMALAPRLLALADGERRMTNLQHLSELLQQLAHDQDLSLEALAKRIADERLGEGEGFDGEARLLRLESDEQLVKIVTIHTSKGLEYPIVYCPFLWDGAKPKARPGPLKFHGGEDHGAALDFGSPELEAHTEAAEGERRAELLRLAYVALTRAKHRCVVVWGGIRDAELSPLAWLLHGVQGEDFKKLDDAALLADLQSLAATTGNAVDIQPLPDDIGQPWQPVATAPDGLQARVFGGRIAAPWRTHSFTGWLATAPEELPDHDRHVLPVQPSSGEEGWAAPIKFPTVRAELVEAGPEPDEAAQYSQGVRFDKPLLSELEGLNANGINLHFSGEEGDAGEADGAVNAFPRGANAGSALHALFEHGDFARFDAADPAIAQRLAPFGIAVEWAPLAGRLVADVLACELDDGLRLAGLDKGRQLREMEFLFPIAAPDMAALAKAIGPGQGADGQLAQRVARLSAPQAAGFLKGYIDLVFEHQGRLCLLDYKSNWLGPRFADYGPAALAAAMAAEHYDLQALIYAVALHRLQRLRQPDYDFDAHMGAAYYLFLRGMRPDAPGSGVFCWRPERALVERVDACLRRQAGDERLMA